MTIYEFRVTTFQENDHGHYRCERDQKYLSRYLARVKAGEEIVITERGRPIQNGYKLYKSIDNQMIVIRLDKKMSWNLFKVKGIVS